MPSYKSITNLNNLLTFTMHRLHGPKRIVCMTEESTEWLYLLDRQDRIVGISGFTVRPPQARKEKPKVALFTDANIDEILALRPDLVIGFSDIQAGIAKDLIQAGVEVWISNQRSIPDIFEYLWRLGAWVHASPKAESLLAHYQRRIDTLNQKQASEEYIPKIYFEEWPDPKISAIRWVSELISIAGGKDIFAERATMSLAKDRIVSDQEIITRNPDLILGSWCGKAFKPQSLYERAGWKTISALQHRQLFEVKSSIILQPGPAALTEGLDTLVQLIDTHRSSRQKESY